MPKAHLALIWTGIDCVYYVGFRFALPNLQRRLDKALHCLVGTLSMKLAFEKDELLHVLQLVQGVAGGRNTLPILSNVLIRAENGNIECAATDLEVSIKAKVIGTIIEEGVITVSAKRLTDIVRELPDTTIEIVTTANHQVELTCGEGKYKVYGLSEEDFPHIPSIDDNAITVDGDTLRAVIHKTEFAASTEEVRYLLNGIYFNLQEEKNEVVATDGIRQLALTYSDIFERAEDVSGFIIPLKAVKEIAKTFANSPEIRISLLKNQLLLADNNATLSTRLVEGEFPKYQDIIPTSFEGRVVVARVTFLQAIRRVALLSDPKQYAICLDIAPSDIHVSAQAPALGEAYETVATESGSGSVRIGSDARALVDILAHIESEFVILEFSGEFSQFIVKPVGDDGQLHVIMPIRLETPSTSKI